MSLILVFSSVKLPAACRYPHLNSYWQFPQIPVNAHVQFPQRWGSAGCQHVPATEGGGWWPCGWGRCPCHGEALWEHGASAVWLGRPGLCWCAWWSSSLTRASLCSVILKSVWASSPNQENSYLVLSSFRGSKVVPIWVPSVSQTSESGISPVFLLRSLPQALALVCGRRGPGWEVALGEKGEVIEKMSCTRLLLLHSLFIQAIFIWRNTELHFSVLLCLKIPLPQQIPWGSDSSVCQKCSGMSKSRKNATRLQRGSLHIH